MELEGGIVACLSSVLPALLSTSIHLGNGEELMSHFTTWLLYITNTEAYMEVAFDKHTRHKYSELLTKDRETIVVHKWNNMDKCSI